MLLEALLATTITTTRPHEIAPLGSSRREMACAHLAPPSVAEIGQSDPSTVIAAPDETSSVASDNLARLISFIGYRENWDGDGAHAPSIDALGAASHLLSHIAGYPLTFGVHLNSDGEPVFFLRDSEYEGEIVVHNQNEISFSFDRGGASFEAFRERFDVAHLPDRLATALDSIAYHAAEIPQAA